MAASRPLLITCLFFFNDTAPTEIYTLSLHDALPIPRQLAKLGRQIVETRLRLAAQGLTQYQIGRAPELQSRPHLVCRLLLEKKKTLNVVLAIRYPPAHRLTNREATFYLGFDVLQLAALLYLTGGIANPFALMFVAPVVIAAATLNLGNVLILAGIAFASVSVIAIVHRPLPWPVGDTTL